MARRKKEEPAIHRSRIADEAQKLFSEKGIGKTSMDEIAAAAGYSKATLYVYFKNKSEIVDYLAEKSLSSLKSAIMNSAGESDTFHDRFMKLCFSLAQYQEDFPEYFDISLNFIAFTPDTDVYKTGEELNEGIRQMFAPFGVDLLTKDIFQLWGMISGLIKLADQKKEYINLVSGLDKERFLEEGFERLFLLIKCL